MREPPKTTGAQPAAIRTYQQLSDQQTVDIEVLRAWYTTVAALCERAIKDAALAKMNEWVAQYVKIAKVALRGKKQSLDASADRRDGVTARTTKTAAQRAAPQKAAATRAAKKA